MLKSLRAFMSLVTLISILRCPTSLSQETATTVGKPIDFHCLSRKDEEKVEVCIEENFICHQSLKKAVEIQKLDWAGFALAIASGFAAGLIVESQLKR